MTGKAVNVFCGSQVGNVPEFHALTVALARSLVEHGFSIIYGGASVGLMGILADTALSLGGRVVGVMPQHLVDREVAHKSLSELHVVQSMAERKQKMGALSDAFIALPGGLGTLDEVFEVATEVQLGLHEKPVLLLDNTGYYKALVQFLDTALQAGLLNARTRAIVRYATNVDSALAHLKGM